MTLHLQQQNERERQTAQNLAQAQQQLQQARSEQQRSGSMMPVPVTPPNAASAPTVQQPVVDVPAIVAAATEASVKAMQKMMQVSETNTSRVVQTLQAEIAASKERDVELVNLVKAMAKTTTPAPPAIPKSAPVQPVITPPPPPAAPWVPPPPVAPPAPQPPVVDAPAPQPPAVTSATKPHASTTPVN